MVSAALATAPPLAGMDLGSSFDIVGHPTDPANRPHARVSAVSGDYARTLGTPVMRGRMISDDDVASSPFVAVVNEVLAKKYFAGKDPLGQQVSLGGKETGMLKPFTIVGVLGDQVDRSVGGDIQPFILLPQQQIPTTSLFYQGLLKTMVSFVVKTRGNIPVATEMRSVFHEFAPGFALDNFRTMQQAVDENTFSQRLGLYLVASFAGLAVMMVIAGLYGVLSQLVSYRRREIGVRMALGATRRAWRNGVAARVNPDRSRTRHRLAAGICQRSPDPQLLVPSASPGRLDLSDGCVSASPNRIGRRGSSRAQGGLYSSDASAARRLKDTRFEAVLITYVP